MRTDGEREKSGSEKPREEGVSKELQKGIEGERKRERRKGEVGGKERLEAQRKGRAEIQR